jgi:hypothetical protein
VDQINSIALTNLPILALEQLLRIFNSCFDMSYSPSKWKIAKIIVIPKKDDESDNPANYRPISLLSCIGKILEKVINLRLNDWAETQKLLNCNQSGFRANHSTQENLFKLIEAAKKGFQNGLKST